jgi:hypothetical protein
LAAVAIVCTPVRTGRSCATGSGVARSVGRGASVLLAARALRRAPGCPLSQRGATSAGRTRSGAHDIRGAGLRVEAGATLGVCHRAARHSVGVLVPALALRRRAAECANER